MLLGSLRRFASPLSSAANAYRRMQGLQSGMAFRWSIRPPQSPHFRPSNTGGEVASPPSSSGICESFISFLNSVATEQQSGGEARPLGGAHLTARVLANGPANKFALKLSGTATDVVATSNLSSTLGASAHSEARTNRGRINRLIARSLDGFRRLGVFGFVHKFFVPSPAVPALDVL